MSFTITPPRPNGLREVRCDHCPAVAHFRPHDRGQGIWQRKHAGECRGARTGVRS